MLLPNGGLVPDGRAGSGSAFILTPDTRAPRILEAGARLKEASQAKAAALRQKQELADAKELDDRLKYKTNTGRLFQDSFMEQVVPGLQTGVRDLYNPAAGVSRFERMTRSNKLLDQAEAVRVMGEQKDKYLADTGTKVRSDPTRNFDGWNSLLQGRLRDEQGRRLRADEFDELQAVRDFDNDLRTYNPQQVALASLKGLLHDDYNQTSDAGVVGGKSFSDVLQSRLVKVAGGRALTNADGSPVLDTEKYLQAADQPGSPLHIVLNGLEKQYAEKRAADPSLPKMSRQGFFNELVAPLAKVNYRHQEHLNRAPAKSGSGSSAATYGDVRNIAAGFDGADFTVDDYTQPAPPVIGGPSVQQPGAPSWDNGLGLAKPTWAPTQQPATRVYSSTKGDVPTFATKPGQQGKPYEFKNGLNISEVILPDANGNLQQNTNNATPIFGSFGRPQLLPVDPKTGKVAYPTGATEEEAAAAERQLYAQGYEPRMYVAVNTTLNKNFAKDRDRFVREIEAREASKLRQDPDGYTKLTRGEIEEEASKLAAGGVVQGYVPYNGKTAGAIDPLSRNYYRDWYRAHAKGKAKTAPAPNPSTPAKKSKTTGVKW